MAHFLLSPPRPRPDFAVSAIEQKLQEVSFDYKPMPAQAYWFASDWRRDDLAKKFESDGLTVTEIGK